MITLARLAAAALLASTSSAHGAAGASGLTVACRVRAEAADRTEPAVLVEAEAPGDAEPRWSLSIEPTGAWKFRAASAGEGWEYLPTAPRQAIDDGHWHHIAVSADFRAGETRFFFDGENVAIFARAVTAPAAVEAARRGDVDGVELRDLEIRERPSTATEIRAHCEEGGGVSRPPARAGDTVRVIAWNIWHGGREDGERVGVDRVIRAIRESRADIVCMQETYGSGPRIADALGYHLYLRSSNLSVMSRFPIEETFDLYQPFRFGACRVRLREDAGVIACPLWINYLPDWWGDDRPVPGCDVERILAAENETRGKEIRAILAALAPLAASANAEPLIVAGDFNSMSHLDWGPRFAHVWGGEAIEWPVSRAMADAGFVDAFRAVHPDVERHPGRTWSPRFTEALQTRIDYVYVKGDGLAPVAAGMIDRLEPRWPSDHAAVVVELRLDPRAASE